jgi:hypothetical protein
MGLPALPLPVVGAAVGIAVAAVLLLARRARALPPTGGPNRAAEFLSVALLQAIAAAVAGVFGLLNPGLRAVPLFALVCAVAAAVFFAAGARLGLSPPRPTPPVIPPDRLHAARRRRPILRPTQRRRRRPFRRL